MAYVAMRGVEQMGERRHAHKRWSNGDARRVRKRGHPQLPLVRLVKQEGAELLGCARHIEQIFEIQVVVDLSGNPCVNIFPHARLRALASSWTSSDRSGRAWRRPRRAIFFNLLVSTTDSASLAASIAALVVGRDTRANSSASDLPASIRCFLWGGIIMQVRGPGMVVVGCREMGSPQQDEPR